MGSRLCRRFNTLLKDTFPCIPARLVLGIMGFFGTFNVYSLRVNLSAAIVAMVDYDELGRLSRIRTMNDSSTIDPLALTARSNVTFPRCEMTNYNNESTISYQSTRRFLWNENTQGLILGSYFYGYVCSQIFGAWIARRLGRVRVWGVCILLASLCTLLIPVMSDLGVPAIVTLRIVIGLFSGVSFPLMQGMWSSWAPPSERSKLLTIHYAGAPAGTLVILPISGVIANTFGWESIFYLTGVSGAVWSLAWLLLVHDLPAKHPRISDKERIYIQTSLGHDSEDGELSSQSMPVPWLSLLTSMPFMSTLVPHFAANFATFIFLTLLPTYLATVMNFDMRASASLSAIPHVAKLFLFPITGIIADWFISNGARPIFVRKIWTSIGLLVPGTGLIISGYVGCNVPLIMFLFSLPDALDTFTIPGYKAAMLEIAPAFGGVTFAICNTVATTSGFLGPQIAGALRRANRDDPIQGWRSLFWLGGAVYFIGGIVFLIFGSSKEQEWAKAENSNQAHKENRKEDSDLLLMERTTLDDIDKPTTEASHGI